MAIYLLIIAPFIAALASGFVKKSLRSLYGIAIASSIIEAVAVTIIIVNVVSHGVYQASSYFSVDALGAILIMIVGFVGTIISWHSVGYLRIEAAKKIIGFRRVRQYFILLYSFLLMMFVAVMSASPILAWITIEATTLSTAFLISFYNKPSSMEAAWKYLIINSVGLLLAFFGTLLFLAPTVQAGHHGLITWQTLLITAQTFNPLLVKLAFIFVLIGYGTKVGLVPMHTWLPDAHSKAPAPISALLSGVLLNVAFLAILRFKAVIDLAIGFEFSKSLLMYFGLMSIVLAAFIIFGQKNYKRLLAYSSIEHMGVVALGFGFGGIGAFAALLHMVYHALTKSILFLSAGNIFLKYSSTKIAKIKGALAVLPITAPIFIIGFLAITGMPPFGIFLTEFSIVAAGIHSHPIIVSIALLALALVFIGFLQHVAGMMFGEKDSSLSRSENGFLTIMPIILLVVILIIASFYIPASLSSLIHEATLIYQ